MSGIDGSMLISAVARYDTRVKCTAGDNFARANFNGSSRGSRPMDRYAYAYRVSHGNHFYETDCLNVRESKKEATSVTSELFVASL